MEAQVGLLLLNASWQAGLLAVVVAAICRLAGSQIGPRWQFMLWGVMFVRLACPLLPSSPLSVWNLLAISDQENTAVNDSRSTETNGPLSRERVFQPPSEPSPESDSSRSANPRNISSPPRHITTPPVPPSVPIASGSQPAQDNPPQIESKVVIWWGVLGIWAIVAGILLVRQCFRWTRLWALSATWREVADADILRLLEECRHQCGIQRPVRLRLSDRPIGPATLGLFRPQIVLPGSLIHSLDPGELRMVFLHEMNHVRRLDVLWDQLAAVLAAVHWFNPAAWWALYRLRDTRELACDAAVLSHLGSGHARPYGELVVNSGFPQCHAAVRKPLS